MTDSKILDILNKESARQQNAKNLMQAHFWGLKTFYYSLINKQGSKQVDEAAPGELEVIDFDDQEDCESCKL